jgi:excisionase family DNA binding protein
MRRKRAQVEFEPVLLGVEDCAKCLSVGVNHVWALIKEKKLDARKDGFRTLIPMESIKKYAKSLPAAR